MTKNYIATKGRLNPQHRQNPERQPPPFARPVIDSGTAFKTVYLSRAPEKWGNDELLKALEHHEYLMRKELQAKGYIVRKTIRTVSGLGGDVRVQMLWEVLGEKRTKTYRRNRAKLGLDAAVALNTEGVPDQPGRPEAQEDSQSSAVPL